MQVLTTLKRPIVTEKTTLLQERNKYVFEVMPYATKGRVRAAVERAFNVRVTAVNILKTRGEQRRIGRNRRLVRSADTKKAVVTVREGDTIQIFEGA